MTYPNVVVDHPQVTVDDARVSVDGVRLYASPDGDVTPDVAGVGAVSVMAELVETEEHSVATVGSVAVDIRSSVP